MFTGRPCAVHVYLKSCLLHVCKGCANMMVTWVKHATHDGLYGHACCYYCCHSTRCCSGGSSPKASCSSSAAWTHHTPSLPCRIFPRSHRPTCSGCSQKRSKGAIGCALTQPTAGPRTARPGGGCRVVKVVLPPVQEPVGMVQHGLIPRHSPWI